MPDSPTHQDHNQLMNTTTMKAALAVTTLVLVAAVVFGVMNHQDNNDLRSENSQLRAELERLKAEELQQTSTKDAELRRSEQSIVSQQLLANVEKKFADFEKRISVELAGARSELQRQQDEARKIDQRFKDIKENAPATLTRKEREIRDAASIAKIKVSEPELGFVTISAGRLNNISEGAEFAVRRGTDFIALLEVRDITSMSDNECPAQIVPGSLVSDTTIQVGDEVIERLGWMEQMVQN